MSARPPGQRWIKRPPRPSRRAPPTPQVRPRPGWMPLLLALGFGLSCGIFGAILGPLLIDRPGMGGLFAGLGFAGGFMLMWKGHGGTMQDIRNLFG